MLRLHAHPPRQAPSAQRKRFSTRCIFTQTLWGDLLCFARRSVVVYCEETLLGLDLWWGYFGGIFWWDFSRLFLRENSAKNPQKKSAPQNPHRPPQNPRKNPHPKIREKKSAPKNPHPKIRTKKSAWEIHTHMSVQKSQPPPWVKQTPANQYQRRLWTACPTWRLAYDAWRQPRQFYTDHHILISRCWQRKKPKQIRTKNPSRDSGAQSIATFWEQICLSDQSALIDASLWRKPL